MSEVLLTGESSQQSDAYAVNSITYAHPKTAQEAVKLLIENKIGESLKDMGLSVRKITSLTDEEIAGIIYDIALQEMKRVIS